MRQIKHADLGYEDEAICYLIATTSPTPARPPRVVARPHVTKGLVRLLLCTATGLDTVSVTKREATWRSARHARWGERWEPSVETSTEE